MQKFNSKANIWTQESLNSVSCLVSFMGPGPSLHLTHPIFGFAPKSMALTHKRWFLLSFLPLLKKLKWIPTQFTAFLKLFAPFLNWSNPNNVFTRSYISIKFTRWYFSPVQKAVTFFLLLDETEEAVDISKIHLSSCWVRIIVWGYTNLFLLFLIVSVYFSAWNSGHTNDYTEPLGACNVKITETWDHTAKWTYCASKTPSSVLYIYTHIGPEVGKEKDLERK